MKNNTEYYINKYTMDEFIEIKYDLILSNELKPSDVDDIINSYDES